MTADPLRALRRHYEQFLKRPLSALKIPVPGAGEFMVEAYADVPVPGAVTYVTMGMSALQGSGPRQELLLSVWKAAAVDEVARLVGAVALLALKPGEPPLDRGNVLGPAGPLVAGTSMDALYICLPIYFPADFKRVLLSDDEGIDVLWLIPVHTAEVTWIAQHGFSAFEAALGPLEPDLLDLRRPPLHLPAT
jgi:hypothetical protein